jgi:hypothetical protein
LIQRLIVRGQTPARFPESLTDKPDASGDMVSPGYLGMHVLVNSIDRATLIADAVLKEVDRRDWTTGNDSNGRGCVISDHDNVPFEMRQDPITGRLSLLLCDVFRGRRTWSDGKRTPLEKQLANFVEAIGMLLDERRTARLKREAHEAFQARLRARKVERKRRADEEKQAERSTGRTMIAWERAERLRGFASALEAQTTRTEAMADTITVARTVADRLDPFLPDKPPSLETIDYVSFEHWYSRGRALPSFRTSSMLRGRPPGS